MATPLEITFHGPFVFRFGINNAWAYAPQCDEHYLNILTDKEDVDLPLNSNNDPIKTFNLTGPTAGKTVLKNPDSVITYKWDCTWPYEDTYWNYVLNFPAPDYIYGLVPEYVWLYGYDQNNFMNQNKVTEAKYARALRFKYNDSPTAPQFDELSGNQICANHLGSTDPGYSIEIRYGHYASVAKKKEEYYLDAQSCFESMREKLKPCDGWKAFFGENPANSEVEVARHRTLAGGQSGPHDCGAPVMAMLDGVTLNEVPEPKTNVSSIKAKSTK